ncbi:MAG: hypothetical protein M1827_006635 [Pycnora praestabilis]|nr:MAG: hypothetical protein M1827_006635 [Pycnora praestabilis]
MSEDKGTDDEDTHGNLGDGEMDNENINVDPEDQDMDDENTEFEPQDEKIDDDDTNSEPEDEKVYNEDIDNEERVTTIRLDQEFEHWPQYWREINILLDKEWKFKPRKLNSAEAALLSRGDFYNIFEPYPNDPKCLPKSQRNHDVGFRR